MTKTLRFEHAHALAVEPTVGKAVAQYLHLTRVITPQAALQMILRLPYTSLLE